MRIPRIVSISLVALSLFWFRTEATSVKPLNPFDTITDITVDVFVGDNVGSIHKNRLFYCEQKREDSFKAKLKTELEKVLQSAGFKTNPKADDALLIGIWGHQEPTRDGEILNVFLIEVTVIDIDYMPLSPCDDARDFSQTFKAIGVVGYDNLEKVLRSEIMRLLKEMLPPRSTDED